jgi:hypothetical protein
MKENPARRIKKVAPEQDETQPFSREQYDALIQATSAKRNGSRNFRVHTASTKVTQSEFAELERAAAERGLRLSEWIREVLF